MHCRRYPGTMIPVIGPRHSVNEQRWGPGRSLMAVRAHIVPSRRPPTPATGRRWTASLDSGQTIRLGIAWACPEGSEWALASVRGKREESPMANAARCRRGRRPSACRGLGLGVEANPHTLMNAAFGPSTCYMCGTVRMIFPLLPSMGMYGSHRIEGLRTTLAYGKLHAPNKKEAVFGYRRQVVICRKPLPSSPDMNDHDMRHFEPPVKPIADPEPSKRVEGRGGRW